MASPSRSLRLVAGASERRAGRGHPPRRSSNSRAIDTAVGRSGRKILVVDDDPLLRKLVDCRLAEEGFEVVQACGGAEALEYLDAAEGRPDLILLDASMPEMDGFELLRTLASDKERSAIPVIMLTARRGRADVVAGLSHGACDYLTKPIKSEELMSRVNRIFGHAA